MRRRDLGGVGQRMAGFQRGDDAFETAQVMEGLQRLVIGDGDVFCTAAVLQPAMLGADTGIIQAGGDGVGFDDLAVVVLHQVDAIAVQHADLAVAGQRCGVLAAVEAETGRFHADQF